MTWQGVPWFVAGGVHPPEVARLLAYAATGGASGVIGSGDLKVKPTAVPSSSVQVVAGAGIIPNRKVGGGQQSYVGRNPDPDVKGITPTGAGSGRSDLLIARVEDPQYPGSPEPADPADGPYVFTRVIEGVPAGTTRLQDVAGHETDAAIELARIDLPPSTGTVLAAHITDLRTKAAPLRNRQLLIATPTASEVNGTATAGGQVWPTVATWNVRVPEWATRAKVLAIWNQVLFPAGNVIGDLWVRLGASSEPDAVVTPVTQYDTPGSNQSARSTLSNSGDIAIPAGLRGKLIEVQLRAKLGTIHTGGNAARISVGASSSVSLDLEFVEQAV